MEQTTLKQFEESWNQHVDVLGKLRLYLNAEDSNELQHYQHKIKQLIEKASIQLEVMRKAN